MHIFESCIVLFKRMDVLNMCLSFIHTVNLINTSRAKLLYVTKYKIHCVCIGIIICRTFINNAFHFLKSETP
jgi:hypothetical protein